MDRLTRRNDNGIAFHKPLNPDCGSCIGCEDRSRHFRTLVDRLASYEDTGLIPEDIKALQSELEQVKAERDKLRDLAKFLEAELNG